LRKYLEKINSQKKKRKEKGKNTKLVGISFFLFRFRLFSFLVFVILSCIFFGFFVGYAKLVDLEELRGRRKKKKKNGKMRGEERARGVGRVNAFVY
jgi:chromate transport protein ChrA